MIFLFVQTATAEPEPGKWPLVACKEGLMSLCAPGRIDDCTTALSGSGLMENVLASAAGDASRQRAFLSVEFPRGINTMEEVFCQNDIFHLDQCISHLVYESCDLSQKVRRHWKTLNNRILEESCQHLKGEVRTNTTPYKRFDMQSVVKGEILSHKYLFLISGVFTRRTNLQVCLEIVVLIKKIIAPKDA